MPATLRERRFEQIMEENGCGKQTVFNVLNKHRVTLRRDLKKEL